MIKAETPFRKMIFQEPINENPFEQCDDVSPQQSKTYTSGGKNSRVTNATGIFGGIVIPRDNQESPASAFKLKFMDSEPTNAKRYPLKDKY